MMVGGILLGGIGSAAVREIAVARTLNLVLRFAVKTIAAIILFVASLSILVKITKIISTENLLLGIAVIGFGLSVLLQNVTFSVLRTIQDVRSNCIASLMVVFQVPTTVWILMGKSPKVLQLFPVLTVAFGVGTLLAIAIAWRSVREFAVGSSRSSYTASDFGSDVLSFTAINFLSYSAINVDFTLIKILSTKSEFATVASGKIYFERFILPILTLFASVVSLRVLRNKSRWFDKKNVLESNEFKTLILTSLFLVCLLPFGYKIFHASMGSESPNIRLVWIGIASFGYLLFAFNAILFDLLVVSENAQSVLIHVIIFVLLGAVIQWSTFVCFRIPGWAAGWTIFNGIITARLAPRYLCSRTQQ